MFLVWILTAVEWADHRGCCDHIRLSQPGVRNLRGFLRNSRDYQDGNINLRLNIVIKIGYSLELTMTLLTHLPEFLFLDL